MHKEALNLVIYFVTYFEHQCTLFINILHEMFNSFKSLTLSYKKLSDTLF